MELNADLGEQILKAFPEIKVDVHNPQINLYVEVRQKINIYSEVILKPLVLYLYYRTDPNDPKHPLKRRDCFIIIIFSHRIFPFLSGNSSLKWNSNERSRILGGIACLKHF